MSTLHGQFDAATILTGLGERWETAQVGHKGLCGLRQRPHHDRRRARIASAGLTADNLARLTVHMSKKGHINIGWPYKPGDVIAAQMNGSYAAAVTLIDGDAFIDQYDSGGSPIRRSLRCCRGSTSSTTPSSTAAAPGKRHAVRIEAVKKDGSVL